MMQRRITGRSVLWFLIGAFGVVLSVNGVMIWLALESWPGLVSQTPYQDGLAFNRVLEAGENQKTLGWLATVEAPEGAVEISLRTGEGLPLSGAMLTVLAKRPTHEGSDVPLIVDETGPGRYVAALPLPIPGNWDIIIDARHGGSEFHAERRIFVAP
jgi:nitrogen fixation protein FixH